MTFDKYRIDWASDRVYEYLPKYGAYYYLGGFIAFGITHEDSNAQAIAKIENKNKGVSNGLNGLQDAPLWRQG